MGYVFLVDLQSQGQCCHQVCILHLLAIGWFVGGPRLLQVFFVKGFSEARLEAPQLHTCALAMGKLRVDDVNVIQAVQKEVLADLSALHTNSLPPVLAAGSTGSNGQAWLP